MLEDMIVRAKEREIDLQMEKKRKPNFMLSMESSSKWPKVFDSRTKGQYGRSHYGRCDKVYEGMCRAGGLGCFKCGRTGHIIGIVLLSSPLPRYMI